MSHGTRRRSLSQSSRSSKENYENQENRIRSSSTTDLGFKVICKKPGDEFPVSINTFYRA